MADLLDLTPTPNDPAQAFEALRGEVSLLRRAVEGLASARDKVPDYSPTLGAVVEALNTATAALDRIERSPAVRLTPAALTAEIDKAGAPARDADRTTTREAHAALWKAIGRIDAIVERGQVADQQLRWLIWSGAGGALLGMLLMAVLPGAIARSLPESWHVPEWMAARVLRMEQRTAGERLVVTAPKEREGNDC
jgi:hypothetical protein